MRKIFQLVFLLLLAAESHAAVAFVSTATCANPGSVSSFPITHNPANGNTEVVTVSLATTTASVSSITDNGTSVYRLRNSLNNGTAARVEMWSTDPGAVAGAPTTITVNLSGGPSKVIGCAAQYSGVNALGASGSGSNANTAPSTFTAAGGNASDWIINVNNIVVAAFASQGVATYAANVGSLRASAVSAGGGDVGGALGDNTNTTVARRATTTVTLSASSSWAEVSLELQGKALAGDLLQFAYVGTPNSSLSLTIVLGKRLTAGKLLVVYADSDDGTTTVPTISDTGGNTFTAPLGTTGLCGVTGFLDFATVWYASNIAAPSSPESITITFPAAHPFSWVAVAEFNNQATASPLDQSSVTINRTDTSTVADSGSKITTFANELIIGIVDQCATSSISSGTNFLSQEDSPLGENANEPDVPLLVYRAVTTVGAYSATASLSPAPVQGWIALMLTFKNASQPACQ